MKVYDISFQGYHRATVIKENIVEAVESAATMLQLLSEKERPTRVDITLHGEITNA